LKLLAAENDLTAGRTMPIKYVNKFTLPFIHSYFFQLRKILKMQAYHFIITSTGLHNEF
jgi:hypothetical protein